MGVCKFCKLHVNTETHLTSKLTKGKKRERERTLGYGRFVIYFFEFEIASEIVAIFFPTFLKNWGCFLNRKILSGFFIYGKNNP